jgi:SAM-dependent methyltransferase
MPDHPLFAAVYDRLLAPAESAGLAARRRRLLSSARGRVLEVGGGTGLNLPHYPANQVSSVVVIEPDGAMRRRLDPRVAEAPVPVEVQAKGIDELTPDDGPFDTVVCTLVLCTVPDLDGAIRAIDGVLAPDGVILFLEHVHVPGWRGHLQHWATPVWRQMAGGCHLDRDPVVAFADAGLAVIDCEKFNLPLGMPLVQASAQGRVCRRAKAPA